MNYTADDVQKWRDEEAAKRYSREWLIWLCDQALKAMTPQPEATAIKAIADHNEGCELACKARRPIQGGDGCGYQTTDGSPIYGRRRCPECPLDWMIEVQQEGRS
jgi:hypothetical protein